MEDPTNKARAAATPDLTPLALRRTGDHLEFVLKPHEGMFPELPADYEQLLANRLADILLEKGPLTVTINLYGVTAVSSRQLGSLIALGKVLRPRFGRAPLSGVSPTVHRLLQVTRTDQLFKYTGAAPHVAGG